MIPQKKLIHEITIPQGVKATLSEEGLLTIEGPEGAVSKLFDHPLIEMKIEQNKITITPRKFTRNEKILVNTYKAHILNMMLGVQKLYTYELKVCSSHFPMTVIVEGDKLVVKNLFGEKVPRKAKIIEGVKVTVDKDIVTVKGPNKESVSQTAANIEQCTRITNRDRRVFADGIWISKKEGESL